MEQRTLTPRLDRALRYSAAGHRGQDRKGSGAPYVTHVFAVALTLDRAGFDEDVVIAGLLHDLVEDTDATFDQIRERFGDRVAELVRACSEIKLDAEGRKRPWIDRKRDHLAAIVSASTEAKAVILADKLHNLVSIRLDIDEGRPVWDQFNAGRDQVLWYYRESIAVCEAGEHRLGAWPMSVGRRSTPWTGPRGQLPEKSPRRVDPGIRGAIFKCRPSTHAYRPGSCYRGTTG